MRTNVLSHITFATQWEHVRAAYIASVTVDGETFEKPSERDFNSPAVMQAVAVLENAILAELGEIPIQGDGPQKTAAVTTLRAINEERNRALALAAVKEVAAQWDKANPSPSAEYDENGIRKDAPPEVRGVAGDDTARPLPK